MRRRLVLITLVLVALIGLGACDDEEHFVEKEEPEETVVAPGELEEPGAEDDDEAGEVGEATAGEAAEAPEEVDPAEVADDELDEAD